MLFNNKTINVNNSIIDTSHILCYAFTSTYYMSTMQNKCHMDNKFFIIHLTKLNAAQAY